MPENIDSSLFSIAKTIVRQAIVVALCFAVGGLIIGAFHAWGRSWMIYQAGRPPNPEFRSLFYMWGVATGSLGLAVIIAGSTMLQFSDALSARDVFWWTWQLTGIALIVALVFTLLLEAWFLSITDILLVVAFFVMLFASLGLLVSSAQALGLKMAGFDAVKHAWLVSNAADQEACRLGILPYRQRVNAFWWIIIPTIGGLLFLLVGFWLVQMDSDNFPGLVVCLVIFAIGVYRAIGAANALINPAVVHIEGRVSRKWTERDKVGKVRGTKYLVTCNNRTLTVDSRIWENLREGRQYRLWVSPVANHVVGFEQKGG